MSVNAPNQTPILRTNFVNNGLLKRAEKTRISSLLTNIVGRDGVWVRRKGTKTEIGLRDYNGTASQPYHFRVDSDTSTTVKVRGGWWARYNGESRSQIDLDDGAGGTITEYADSTAAITVTDTGVIYLELDTVSAVNTLTAKFATDAAWAALTGGLGIRRKIIADIVWASGAISAIRQSWRGGNILDTNAEPYHFEVIQTDSTHFRVRAGAWTIYDEEAREETELTNAGLPAGKSGDYDNLTSEIAVGVTGFVYLEINHAGSPNQMAVEYAAAIPANDTDYMRKKIATITYGGGAITGIEQNWRGGNILMANPMLSAVDDLSIERANGVNQFLDYDSPTTGVPVSGDMVPFRPSGGTALRYSTIAALTQATAPTVDNDSLDLNADTELQMFGWAAAVAGSGVQSEDLLALKQYNTGDVAVAASYVDDLIYRPVGDLLVSLHGALGAAVSADATDLASAITLVNELKARLIAANLIT